MISSRVNDPRRAKVPLITGHFNPLSADKIEKSLIAANKGGEEFDHHLCEGS